MNRYEYVKNYRQKQKENIIYVMGGKCACCGYNKCNRALELHHLKPDEKEFSISENTNKAWELVIKELPKTILLCANCHREVHDGLIDNDNLITSFDTKKASEISLQLESSKTKIVNKCADCGQLISRSSTYCMSCWTKRRQATNKPSREQLKNDIRNLSMVKVGEKYNVTDNAIRKWCDGYNLPRRVSDIKKYSDEEWQSI